jgi:small subunit ribosomal protein S17
MMKKCVDVNCPFHGSIKVRGKLIEGVVVKKKNLKTVQVLIEERRFIPKYERYIKLRHKYSVHCPECLDINLGDKVLCGECRKISKTKSFVVMKKLDSKKEVKEESKTEIKKVAENKETLETVNGVDL